jgi:hypothetical protein
MVDEISSTVLANIEIVFVTAVVVITILRVAPPHSYYCCGSTFRWI